MKQRILSIALVLCLCVSSQSAAYAWQEDPSPQEEVLTEESPDETETSEDVDTDLTEESSDESETSEDVDTDLTEESPDESETSEGEDTDLTEESPDELETSEDVDTGLTEESSTIEEVHTEEVSDEPETGEDVDTDLVEVFLLSEDILAAEFTDEPAARDNTVPTPAEAYEAMIALKSQDQYKEGTTWNDDKPYSGSNGYYWNGGLLDGNRISATGCVAFAFILSDAAFDSLSARMYGPGAFTFEDIKVGDILRLNTDTHTVIVLEVSDTGVVVAEGNYNETVHWGRSISREEVMNDTSHYITRYPEGYIPPDDPTANDIIGSGTLDGGLPWKLTKAGTLTISGKGAMPDFSSAGEQPWSSYSSQIRKVIIEEGITSIGSCAFWSCGVLSAEIPSSVTAIGNSAFRESSIISVTIPSSVKTIGDSAFRKCQDLSSATVSEGVETISQNAFRACTSLKSVALPASIGEVGAGAFAECKEMRTAAFARGSKQVKFGDNIFTRCWYLMSVTLPSNIDRIGKEMFMACGMLAGVEIPQGAESIEGSAFASCSVLTTVIIPDSVTAIDTAAFSNCALTDIYFTGTEAQWNSISKTADVITDVSNATIHYNYTPAGPDDSDDNNTGDDDIGDNDNNTGDDNTGDNGNNDNNTGDNTRNDHIGDKPENDSIKPIVETWKPTTPDEIRRYICVGKEVVQYTQPKDTVYRIDIENAMQGPMCFQSFDAVLGDYTIGRTYNIYALSKTTYSIDQEIQLTIQIPSAIYKKDREYKMICVTKGGQPFLYEDLDSNPQTITIETDKFYAYALIYK